MLRRNIRREAAQRQPDRHRWPCELVDFGRFFFAAFVDIGEITGGFSLNQQRKVRKFRSAWLDYRIDRDSNVFRIFIMGLNENIQVKCERAWFHFIEWDSGRVRLELVAFADKPLFQEGELTLFLRISDNWFGDCAAETVCDDG
jgi:hypothetical protein